VTQNFIENDEALLKEARLTAFDHSALMNRVMGDKNLASRVLSVFLKDVPRQVQSLQDEVATGTIEAAGRQAHRIQGACATVGAEAMRRLAYEIEKAASANDPATVKSRAAELPAYLAELNQALAVYAQPEL
jgi:HPt (histidine-containing phosphotransfer) domain-containing protein